MDPVTLYSLFNAWSPFLLAIYTFLVTASSILLKTVMIFVSKKKELDPSYSMGKVEVFLISLLTALSHNSKSAAEIRK